MRFVGLLVCLVPFVGSVSRADDVDAAYQLLIMDAREQLVYRRESRLQQLPAAPPVPDVQGPVFNEIDRFITARWHEAGVPSALDVPPVCSDNTFLRRVYLDVLGRIPTMEEAHRFLQNDQADKRSHLIDELLNRHEEYADHWTPFWEEAIASNPAPIVGGIPSRGNYQKWLGEHFQKNTPFDVMVAELIDPRMPGHRRSEFEDVLGKPTQTGFILNQTHTDTIQTAAVVGQVFLGTGMKCASCHDHFENDEWPQARFLAFGGLFSSGDLTHIRCEKTVGGTVPAAFPFAIPGAPTQAPADVDGRLHYLALLLTDPLNPRFSKTIVNRLWRRYMGLGLFEPIDDFRSDAPPSHPDLLEWLARDLMTHGYDLKHTIRQILNSRTYQLRYDPAREDHFDNANREAPRYCQSPALRKLTAEQLVDSIRLATRQTLTSDERLFRTKATTPLSRSLSRPASRNEISTTRSEETAVVQALELLNGNEYHHLIYEPGPLTSTAAAQDIDGILDTLYLAILTRAPTADERLVGRAFLHPLSESSDDRVELLGDLSWALVTSVEFQYIH
ncbi:MAG: DUF1553 domain-containing protein [Planctomycetota bacterium]|nr:DUF1553 domain-containing protein [Planctomycetota bacterium]MDA1177498.1 DUF1553 domain-containing protein [Planctomycetota bacterium]